jgi:hypothetical protein
MSGLAAGQRARIVFRSDPERAYAGEVARLGRQTDPETREFLVDVRVTSLPPNWTIGQRAEVYVTTAEKSAAASVPANVVHTTRNDPGVFVIAGGKARWRPVQLGLRGRDRVEIIGGLAAGERVVTARVPRTMLTDGQRIAAP